LRSQHTADISTSQLTQDCPLEILNHSWKHGYKDLADRAAPYTLSCQLGDVVMKLTTEFLLQRWVCFFSGSLNPIKYSNTLSPLTGAISRYVAQDLQTCA